LIISQIGFGTTKNKMRKSFAYNKTTPKNNDFTMPLVDQSHTFVSFYYFTIFRMMI